MHGRRIHARRFRGLLIATSLWSASFMLACGKSKAEPAVSPGVVTSEYKSDWNALERARAEDPEGDAVDEAADQLLDRAPPLKLQLAALHAKVERAERTGDDAGVVALSADALARIEEAGDAARHAGTQRTFSRARSFALARSGEPEAALAALAELDSAGNIETIELRAARAQVLDRKGDTEEALLAYLSWRESVRDQTADAAYAEERAWALATSLDASTLAGLIDRASGPASAACLSALAGRGERSSAAAWVARCRSLPHRIGVLLPRSGKLAALSDRQLAAATAAVEVLAGEREVEVLWQDSGSTPETARAGALALADQGVEIIVGPVGGRNVAAATSALGPERFVVPGETTGNGVGVAPTLGQRTDALVTRAHAAGPGPIHVLAPDNGYGRRAVAAAQASAERLGHKGMKIQYYSTAQTSFAETLRPWIPALSKGAPLIIPDGLGRVELVVRQLRRSGVYAGDPGAVGRVSSTGEGVGPKHLGAGHDVLEGLILSPVAAPNASSVEFERVYARRQGEGPDDQALLVWEAFRRAWTGAGRAEVEARLVRVERGSLVAIERP